MIHRFLQFVYNCLRNAINDVQSIFFIYAMQPLN